MGLIDRLQPLTTPAQVDDFLRRHACCALYKVGSCFKNAEIFPHLEAQLGTRQDLPVGVVRVLEWRPASDHVAALTGIRHESPQIIFFRSGRAVFDRDNWDITGEALAQALSQHFAAAPA